MAELIKYYPSEEGTGTNYGYMRLKITEIPDEDTNTSDITVELQVKAPYACTWQVEGTATIDGETVFSDGTLVPSTGDYTTWQTAAVWSKSGIEHDDDGKLSIYLTLTGNSTFPNFTLYRADTVAYQYMLYVPAVTDYEIELTTLEVGDAVYIGGEKYDAYIGNGSTWDKYTVKIM